MSVSASISAPVACSPPLVHSRLGSCRAKRWMASSATQPHRDQALHAFVDVRGRGRRRSRDAARIASPTSFGRPQARAISAPTSAWSVWCAACSTSVKDCVSALVGGLERRAVVGEALHQQRDADVAEEAERLRRVGRDAAQPAREARERVRALGRHVPEARELSRRRPATPGAARSRSRARRSGAGRAARSPRSSDRGLARQGVERRVHAAQHGGGQRHVASRRAARCGRRRDRRRPSRPAPRVSSAGRGGIDDAADQRVDVERAPGCGEATAGGHVESGPSLVVGRWRAAGLATRAPNGPVDLSDIGAFTPGSDAEPTAGVRGHRARSASSCGARDR